jgi:hypothetical protein
MMRLNHSIQCSHRPDLIDEMHFLKALADTGKIIQGLIVAQKNP